MSNLEWVILGIIIAMMAIIGFQYWENGKLETDLSTVQAQAKLLEEQNSAFSKQVSDQNAGIAKLASEKQQEHERAEAAITKAEQLNAQYTQKEADLDAIKRTGDECKDTFSYIDTLYGAIK